MSWKQALDRAHSLAALDALEPAAIVDELAAEIPVASMLAELEARDAQLREALIHLDTFATRAMALRLDHALAGDTSIASPTRKVFSATIVAYAADLGLLAQRARDVAARGRAADPDVTTDLVVTAARRVLDLRAELRGGICELARRLAIASIADADRRARDRTLPDRDRLRWSAMRRDLEAVAADPACLRTPIAARVAALPDQIDEPAPGPEVTFADMIELD